jgi:sulfite reductase (NADPH) flavoprotein alpha-component
VLSDRPEFSLVVGYASDMGAAEYVAMLLANALKDVGIDVTETELNDIGFDELRAATHFVVVTSTWGDGELPDNGALFWEMLSADAAERLDHLDFAVFALGDSGYELFCNAGRIIDQRLEELGADRMADRVECDGFYETPAAAWIPDMVKLLDAARRVSGSAVDVVTSAPAVENTVCPWTHQNPYPAALVVNRRLNAASSDKEVRHYEIDLGDSGITYQAGDSIAVHPVNDAALVQAMLSRLGVGLDHEVDGHDSTLDELLGEHFEIRTPSRAMRELAASRVGDIPADADVVDLIDMADLDIDEVLDTLRPLQFRDYSIASSPLAHPNRVHLTVATVRYALRDRQRGGVASTYLADRCGTVRVHPRPNHHFRLPADDVPIIMVGPGTGVAPFRAFLQQRRLTGATGKSWLFFGDRRRATDYLYGEELQGFLADGVLTRLDLAFSRDGAAKDYVQHHMLADAASLYAWLEEGAYFYVCGDAEHMARDVDRALHEVIATAGGKSADDAHTYVNDLIRSHRYVRDVY